MFFKIGKFEFELSAGLFVKLGKTQAWLERTKHTEWKPVVEFSRERKELELWFLRFYAVFDRA